MILGLPFCLVGEKIEEKRRKIGGTFVSDKIDKENNRYRYNYTPHIWIYCIVVAVM
jgi:hypothetical protein